MRSFFEGFFTIVAVVAALALSSPAKADLRIVVFGDSLTSGYELPPEQAFSQKLLHKLQAAGYTGVEVVNMGQAGETSASAVDRVSAVLMKQPDIVILEMGANDMLRGLEPGTIYQNVWQVMTALKQKGVYILLMGVKAPASQGETYVAYADSIFRNLASSAGGYYPDSLDGISDKPELNLADGFHPNGKGVTVMVDGIYPYVDAALRWKWESLQQPQKKAEPMRPADQMAPLRQEAPHATDP